MKGKKLEFEYKNVLGSTGIMKKSNITMSAEEGKKEKIGSLKIIF